MDYSALEKRIRKSLNYGTTAAVGLPVTSKDLNCKSTVRQDLDDLDLHSSLSLTRKNDYKIVCYLINVTSNFS